MGPYIGMGIFLVVVFILLVCGPDMTNESEDCSIDTHRRFGHYRVLYNDGFLSQPFMRKTAKFYAEHFGGRVVSKNYNGPHRVLPGGGWVNVPANVTDAMQFVVRQK